MASPPLPQSEECTFVPSDAAEILEMRKKYGKSKHRSAKDVVIPAIENKMLKTIKFREEIALKEKTDNPNESAMDTDVSNEDNAPEIEPLEPPDSHDGQLGQQSAQSTLIKLKKSSTDDKSIFVVLILRRPKEVFSTILEFRLRSHLETVMDAIANLPLKAFPFPGGKIGLLLQGRNSTPKKASVMHKKAMDHNKKISETEAKKSSAITNIFRCGIIDVQLGAAGRHVLFLAQCGVNVGNIGHSRKHFNDILYRLEKKAKKKITD
eukprot:gene18584-20449_t